MMSCGSVPLLLALLCACAQRPGLGSPTSADVSPPRVSFSCGTSTSNPKNAWPWVALVGSGSSLSPKWRCNGVLINEQWILTMGHCAIQKSPSIVRLGDYDLSRSDESSHQNFRVSNTVFHPQYKAPQYYHDLALLKLERPVQVNNVIQPICLPWGPKPVPRVGSILTLIGWGSASKLGGFDDILKEASILMFDSQKCANGYSTLIGYRSDYPRGITADLFCIGDQCQHFSGSSAMYREGGNYILTGLLGAGHDTCSSDFPGLYSSIHHALNLAWIKRVAF